MKGLAFLPLTLAVLFVPLKADQASDVRNQISHVADGLSAGNTGDAMKPFDKSFPDYDKLRNYFQALSGYQIENELEFIDQQDTENESKVTVDWTLTLTDPGSNATDRRESEINIRLERLDGKWKIVGFAPIKLFNPQLKTEGKH